MKTKLKFDLITIVALLILAGVVDYFLRLSGNNSLPSFMLISVTIQMLVFMKIYIDKNHQLFAFFLLVLSMICMIWTFADTYSKASFSDISGKVSHDFYGAVYLSIVTWTTLGYGDLRPTESVRILAGLEAITGYLYIGIFVAFAINYLFTAQQKNRKDMETET